MERRRVKKRTRLPAVTEQNENSLQTRTVTPERATKKRRLSNEQTEATEASPVTPTTQAFPKQNTPLRKTPIQRVRSMYGTPLYKASLLKTPVFRPMKRILQSPVAVVRQKQKSDEKKKKYATSTAEIPQTVTQEELATVYKLSDLKKYCEQNGEKQTGKKEKVVGRVWRIIQQKNQFEPMTSPALSLRLKHNSVPQQEENRPKTKFNIFSKIPFYFDEIEK